jgi:hypothetical protein
MLDLYGNHALSINERKRQEAQTNAFMWLQAVPLENTGGNAGRSQL